MMANQESAGVCPECGAARAAGRERCWLCDRALVADEAGAAANPEAANPYVAPRPTGEHLAAQFSLETLFLVTTLVAVCLGVFLLAPGLGVLMALVTVPALARSFMMGYRRKQAGLRLTTGEKISAFVLSFFLMIAVGWAGCAAFFGVCLGTGLLGIAVSGDESVFFVAIGLGAIAGLSLSGWLFWLSRPRSLIFPANHQP